MDVTVLTQRDMELICGSFLFKGAGNEQILRAVSDGLCTLEHYKKGDVIYDVEVFRKNVGIVLSGSVEAEKLPPGGGRFVMNKLSAGSAFGVAGLFGGSDAYVTRLTASEKCSVIFFPQELLAALMKEDFKIAENYITFLSDRVRFLNEKISGLLIPGTERTLRHWLRENACEENGCIFVEPDVSLSALASMLHMGRASLYRALDELEGAGVIKKNGRKIIILDAEKLFNEEE